MHEIIRIVDPVSPSGQLRHGLEIEAVDDRPLSAGYYFVLWPAASKKRRQQLKRYFGPFQTCAEARMLQRSALSFGLIQDGTVLSLEVVECRSIVRPIASRHYPAAYRDHGAAPQNMPAYAR